MDNWPAGIIFHESTFNAIDSDFNQELKVNKSNISQNEQTLNFVIQQISSSIQTLY